jgi:hypothetical protein
MNTMNMPGFTAEATLCRSNRQYRTKRAGSSDPSGVVPQSKEIAHVSVPGFITEVAIYQNRNHYRGAAKAANTTYSVVPALPSPEACYRALDACAENPRTAACSILPWCGVMDPDVSPRRPSGTSDLEECILRCNGNPVCMNVLC